METVNCNRCYHKHEDNGNCAAVGGFCTAVPAAHCPLLREYLATGLTPECIVKAKDALEYAYGNAERIIELAEADKDGRAVVLPCKVDDILYRTPS